MDVSQAGTGGARKKTQGQELLWGDEEASVGDCVVGVTGVEEERS